jgi:hypothetical protein
MTKLRLATLLVAFIYAAPVVGEEPSAPIVLGRAQVQEPAAVQLAKPAQAAGHVLWLFGEVERIRADGAAKPLAKGDPVFEGDVIRSAPGAHAQLLMRDEALLAVRPQSSLKLTKYSYQGAEDGTERAIIELLKGGLRSVTGAIGRSNKDNYQLKNNMHVIGIRGTDHETFATEDGTFNRVTMGGTYLQGAGGRVELAPGEAGFASLRPDAAPVRLAQTPEFMHVAALASSGKIGPQARGRTPGDEHRLQKAAVSAPLARPAASTVMPVQALGEKRGWAKNGRCDAGCVDPVKERTRPK